MYLLKLYSNLWVFFISFNTKTVTCFEQSFILGCEYIFDQPHWYGYVSFVNLEFCLLLQFFSLSKEGWWSIRDNFMHFHQFHSFFFSFSVCALSIAICDRHRNKAWKLSHWTLEWIGNRQNLLSTSSTHQILFMPLCYQCQRCMIHSPLILMELCDCATIFYFRFDLYVTMNLILTNFLPHQIDRVNVYTEDRVIGSELLFIYENTVEFIRNDGQVQVHEEKYELCMIKCEQFKVLTLKIIIFLHQTPFNKMDFSKFWSVCRLYVSKWQLALNVEMWINVIFNTHTRKLVI